ncbi:MAG: alpha-ketoacid dehydrogenase subunit beta [Oleiphilaceae bacterium]|nr:alpha-ketoacid dehydrogenase subunit beta [Oleiphilaceae bacterium]
MNQAVHLSHEVTMIEAINLALHRAMSEHPDVVVLGEDVAVNGGVFRATDQLRARYGIKRVMDTPLAETLIAGVTVGMAAQGLRPVAEIQFMGFIYATMEQIVSHAARLRNRTRGRLHCPMVIRAPFGGGIHAPEHHSESTEALFAHVPGLRVVIPSSPARAYGLLLAAIRNNDPVIFLEPKRIYRSSKSVVVDDGKALPLDTSFVLRRGKDITLISWGASIKETMEAAAKLGEQGVDAEVIDVASVSPIDYQPMLESLEKTGRCLIVHEAARHCGVGAEIAATLQERAFPYLAQPISRVTGYDTIMPYFKNEMHYLPDVNRIVELAQGMVSASREVQHETV